MEGVLIVDQHDRDLLKPDNQVEVMFDTAQLESVNGKIVKFSETEIQELSPRWQSHQVVRWIRKQMNLASCDQSVQLTKRK